jgi:polyhydroxyalkanoate synthesis regulator phasin
LSRLKEILSVEVPKDGDIYVFGDNGDWSHRIKDWNTETNTGSVYNITSATSFTLCNYLDTTKMVKANESEIKKRIEEEHTKGYYWTGSKLIKIPEYVQSCNDGIVKIKFDGKNMWKSETTASSFSILFVINQGRTKEAFEAQEAHKKMDEACKKLGFTKEYVEEITIKGFEAFVAGESLADMVRKYGVENATEFIQKNNRIDELEKEIKLVKEALSDCEKAYQDSVETGCNQAETIKDLIINNKKLTKDLQSTLDENVRLMDTINSVKSDLSKEIERRLNYANTISEMTIEWRKNPKRQAFKNLEKQIEKLREENKNLKDSLSQYSKCVV